MTAIVIWGLGGMGRETADLIRAATAAGADWDLVGFVDDDSKRHGTVIAGLPVLGGLPWLERQKVAVVVAVGSPADRRQIFGQLAHRGCYELPALVHPKATVGSDVQVGDGSIIGPGVVVTTDVQIGRSVIVNSGSTVSHDTLLRDYVTLAPGVHLAGAVSVEEGAEIGAGSVSIPGRTIGQWSIVGAGSVIITDVPALATVVGSPARVIATRRHA
jgi:sugar O-acyltransferase (sialic acid O-acetyltransferase NeuD family)